MNKKLCICLICLVGLSFTIAVPAQNAETQKANWILGVIFKLEGMHDKAMEKIRHADAQIKDIESTIQKSQAVLALSIKNGDSEAERIIRQALAIAQKAKTKAQETKRLATLKKLRIEESIARVRNAAAKLVGVEEEVKSIVSNYSGRVEYYSERAARWYPLEKNRVGYLENGDKIHTGHDGKAELYFLDGEGTITLGPNSTLTIKEDSTGYQTINLFRGSAWFKAEREFEAQTPTVIVAIRGTEFLLLETEGFGTEVIIFKGTVEVYSPKKNKTVVIGPGYKVEVMSDGLFLEPHKVDLSKWGG